MKITEDILDYILSLERSTFNKYLIYFLASILLILGISIYLIHSKGKSLIKQIQTTRKLAQDADLKMKEYKEIQEKKNHILEILDKEKNFEIKGFFESFYKEHKVKPEPRWDTISSPILGNELLKEVSLPVRFKNLTTQKLTEILINLEKKEIVYVKNLKINKNKENRTIDLEITLGALNKKT
ncbi:hypothetical protein KAW80_01550 [Candidatus Babeliales bacterium]|nr:hypothetical protein [Candidatus Babeliales bacterium]